MQRPFLQRIKTKGHFNSPDPLAFCFILKCLEKEPQGICDGGGWNLGLCFVYLTLAAGQGAFLFPVFVLSLPGSLH